MADRKKCGAIWIVIILFSVITGFSASSVLVSKGDLSDFYRSGEVWTIPASQAALTSWNMPYDRESGVFTVADGPAQMILSSNMKKRKWRHLDVTVTDLSAEKLTLELHYYKRDGSLVGEERIELTEGENRIRLHARGFSYFVADIPDQAGVTFSIDAFRLATKRDKVDNRRLFMLGLLISGGLLVILSVVWLLLKRKNFAWIGILYAPVFGLQRLYLWCGERIPGAVSRMRPSVKSRLRVTLLVMLFLLLTVMNVYGIFLKDAYHPFAMLLLCVLLLLLAVLSADGELKLQNWRNPLAISWLVLWFMTCVSDCLVAKEGPIFSFYGYIMIFLVGFLFFIWNQKGVRQRLWRDICLAAEITFYLAAVFCLFCRPEKEGFRYNGAYLNPNPFGLYLAVTGCVFLCELERYILGKQNSRVRLAVSCGSLAALLFFLKKTQCTTGTLALAGVVLLWIAGHFGRAYPAKSRTRLAGTLLLTAVLCLPVSFGLGWGIRNLPELLHTTVAYPGDQDYAKAGEPSLFEETVYAAEAGIPTGQEAHSANRVFEKLFSSRSLDALITGRGNNFISYLKDLNLSGHKKRPMVYGASTKYAHNGLLAYAHTYGVYILIPYIVMNLYFIGYAALYFKRHRGKDGYACLPLAVSLVFLLENMMDNVDIPFHWIVWFLFIFMQGAFFNFHPAAMAVRKEEGNL